MFELAITTVALLGDVVLGLVTYLKNPKSATNRQFLYFAISLGVYLFLNNFALHQNSDIATLYTIRFVMFSSVLVNLAFFLLAHTFPYSKIQIKSLYFWGAFVFTAFLLPLTLSPLIFASVTPGTTQPLPGVGFPLFILHTIVLLGAGIITLALKFHKSTGLVKTQTKIFLTGAAVMFLAILTTNVFFVVVLKTTAFVNMLPLYAMVFNGFISYAILRHRFLDIGVLIARAVTYAVIIGFIAVIYSVFVYFFSRTFLQLNLTGTEHAVLITLMIFVALSFQTIRNSIEQFTDKFLFKGQYNTNQLLGTLSQIMSSTLRLEDLAHGILQVVLRQMRITHGAFIILTEMKIAAVMSEGYSASPAFSDEDIAQIASVRDTIVFDELDETSLKQTLRSLGLSTVVHLRTEGNQIALLLLGAKESGTVYSTQDLSFLEILAPQAAVAIQNSQAYEEIRRFNITLQDEVDKATTDLTSANQKLEVLDKLKDEFVSVASHELRTPMTAIKSYTWMVLNGRSGDINPKTREYLDRVYQSTDRLIHLVNEMLDVSRIEGGRVTLKLEPVDMFKLASDVQAEFSARSVETGLTLTINPLAPLPLVTADREKIHQVLENLVGNSFKFTPRGGHVAIGFKLAADFLEISVTDDGPGIAPDDLPKLFKKFGRLENSLISLSNNSTGLGLYISKQYIELHHGQIWVNSQPGSGAVFTFSLPVANPTPLD